MKRPIPPGIPNPIHLFRNPAILILILLILACSHAARADWNFGEPFKWRQMPDETPNGIDVEMTAPFRLADDFLCTNTGPVTDLHLWASWRNDNKPEDSMIVFNISFWSDQPTNEQVVFSHPLKKLWETNMAYPHFTSRLWKQVLPEGEGWLTPPLAYQPHADVNIWQYNFFFGPTNVFVQEGTPDKPIVYWVAVTVNILGQGYTIGWKTSTNHWNDDAVWSTEFGAWNELRYPPGHPFNPASMDLAFVLTSKTLDFGDAPDGINPPLYPTLLANNGARHTITPAGPWLGPLGDNPDDESDGQPNLRATGDDLDISPLNPGPNYDDENGVAIPTLIIGLTNVIQITVSDPSGVGGYVDGWIDFNTNRIWEPSEQIVAALLPVGTTAIPVLVPASVTATNSYARFRINSLGLLLNPAGPAADGEVEDYEVGFTTETVLLDFGDAPDAINPSIYPTLLINNGARHIITPTGPWLGPVGDNPDDESNGQPNLRATGDDFDIGVPNPGPNYDDEDGVIIPTLVFGRTASIQIIVSDPSGLGGFVDGWIDFNRNGVWELSEQIVAAFLPPGTNTIPVPVPPGLMSTNSYARFRINSLGLLLTPAGLAPDGEVEDYEVELKTELDYLDFGDAPDSINPSRYPTLLVNNGARHVIMPAGPFLGPVGNPDNENDGQPNATATGDDLDIGIPNPGPNYDDEDGVTFTTALVPGFNAIVQVVASGGGFLSAWIDFGSDGSWATPGDQILVDVPVAAGMNNLIFRVPAGAVGTNTAYARFRYSSITGLSFTGLAPDGEVEDHTVLIQPLPLPLPDYDFGDAPDLPYPTLLPNGARHVAYLGFCLGSFIDTESNGQPDPAALLDDNTGIPDDEDGVTFTTAIRRGSNACVDVVLTGAFGPGRLDAWVDFNRNGLWGDIAGEQIFSSLLLLPGTNAGLTFSVPLASRVGTSYARFRLSTMGGLTPVGLAANGEVEDYLVDICQNPPATNVVFTGITVTNASSQQVVTLAWNAETNVIYQLQQTPGLTNEPPTWSDVGPEIVGPANSIALTNWFLFEKYYRIKVPGVCP